MGDAPDRIPLPRVLREALVRWYIGEGTLRDERAGITLVQNAPIGRRCIACGCLGVDKPPPILTPAFLSEAETLLSAQAHQHETPGAPAGLPILPRTGDEPVSETRSHTTPADPPSGFFEVLRPAPEKLSQRPDDDAVDDRTRNAPVPHLARLLWRLMDNAGCNRIAPVAYGAEWSIKEGFAAIGRAAAKIEIAPGIELARALWTHARPLQARAVYAALRQLAPGWPKAHAPQGFVLLYARSFKGQEIHVPEGDRVVIANRVQSPSVRGNRISGPFLVLVVAGEYPEAHGYAPLRAYAQPVHSGRLFVPVDSDFERQVLKQILACQQALHARGVDVAIGKPLFDTLTPMGPCRPDFLLEARSRHTGEVRNLVVEAMGFDDDDYAASKAATHPRMRTMGDLVTIAPDEIEAGDAERKLMGQLDL